jgi:palmitoyltransferase
LPDRWHSRRSPIAVLSVHSPPHCVFFFLTRRRYDHYCPWILTPIGERNHLLFLVYLTVQALVIAYYAALSVGFLWWTAKRSMALLADFVLVLVNTVALVAICLALLGMIGHQCYCISRNITSIEIGKYARERARRRRLGIRGRVKNLYDRGFRANWMQFLFPQRAG